MVVASALLLASETGTMVAAVAVLAVAEAAVAAVVVVALMAEVEA